MLWPAIPVLGIRDILVWIRFSKFFSYNLPTGTLSSVLKILFFALNFCVKIPFCKRYFRKGKDPEAQKHADPTDPDPQH